MYSEICKHIYTTISKKEGFYYVKKAKKICSVILTLAVLTVSFAGCDSKNYDTTESMGSETSVVVGGTNADPPMGEGNNGTIELKVWSPEAAVSIFNKQCKAFSEKYSDFGKIKNSVVPQGESDAATNVLTDPQSAADVFGFACDNIDKLQATDSLLEIAGSEREKVQALTVRGTLRVLKTLWETEPDLQYFQQLMLEKKSVKSLICSAISLSE